VTTLAELVEADLARPVAPAIAEAARRIAADVGGRAVLFYGSVLRTGDLDGVLDFYVLTHAPPRGGPLGRWLWPDVSYHEVEAAGRTIRAKVATMALDRFAAAAEGRHLDTTIWARFVQPCALVWSADPAAARKVRAAVVAAIATAGRFAAALGPARGTARDYWKALFRATYATEFRVEKPGREDQILDFAGDRFDRLLPLAWTAAGIVFDDHGGTLVPRLHLDERRHLRRAWAARRRAGKPLNLARLAKAAFTFDGAARYALWKIERHTGLALPLTPWRERHPILAAPGVLWRVWRR
jgi:hypothetical protein